VGRTIPERIGDGEGLLLLGDPVDAYFRPLRSKLAMDELRELMAPFRSVSDGGG
jgi:hypothetical protein